MTSARPMVLVVEDDDDIRDTVVEVLDDEGLGAVGARGGAEALELLRTGAAKPALILLDLMMPGMSGAELRERLLADPALARIPIVVVTAAAAADESTRDLGVAGSLRKPVKIDALVETVRRFVG